MNKVLTRTALIASLMLTTASLSACGSGNGNCPSAAADNTITATTAVFPSAAGHGGGGHGSSGHGTSGHESTTHDTTGSHYIPRNSHVPTFALPHFFGGNNTQCQSKTPAPAKS